MNNLKIAQWSPTTRFPSYVWFNTGRSLQNTKSVITWLKNRPISAGPIRSLQVKSVKHKTNSLGTSLVLRPLRSIRPLLDKNIQFLHPGRIWSLNNLENLRSLSLLGKGLKTTKVFFNHDLLFDNKVFPTLTVAPIIERTSKWVRTLSNLTSEAQTKTLKTFLNFITLKLVEEDPCESTSVTSSSTPIRVRSIWRTKVRSKLNLQPYAFIGMKYSASRNKSREWHHFIDWKILRRHKSPTITLKEDIYWANGSRFSKSKSNNNFDSWKSWVVRTLRKKKKIRIGYRSTQPSFSPTSTYVSNVVPKQLSFYETKSFPQRVGFVDIKQANFSKKQLMLKVWNKAHFLKKQNKFTQHQITLKYGLRATLIILIRSRNFLRKWVRNSKLLTLRTTKTTKRVKRKKWLRIVQKVTHQQGLTQSKLNWTPLLTNYTHVNRLIPRLVNQKHLTSFCQRRPSSVLRINTVKPSKQNWDKLLNLEYLTRFKDHIFKQRKLLKNTECLLLSLPNIILKASGVNILCDIEPKIPTRVENLPRIYPQHSNSFTRSPFFFFHRSLLRNKMTDVISSIQTLQSRPKYLVFPDANDLKVSIFRKLNKQKNLAYSRSNTEGLLNLTNSQSRLFLPTQNTRLHLTEHDDSILNQFVATSASSPKLWNYKKLGSHSQKIIPRLRRIRFKPGYGRIWRAGRRSVREILGLHHRYQYRLSPKLQILYFKHRQLNTSAFNSTTTLGFSLMTCRFAPDAWTVNELLTSGMVFLNGKTATNTNTRLFLNDFLQLIIHLKYYIALKWVTNFSTFRKNRVSKIFYRKFRPSTRDKEIKVVRTLPTWFYDLQYAFTDVPRFFEVDYFTLSVFMIHEDLPLEKWMPSRARLFDPLILNMYNWKYIT